MKIIPEIRAIIAQLREMRRQLENMEESLLDILEDEFFKEEKVYENRAKKSAQGCSPKRPKTSRKYVRSGKHIKKGIIEVVDGG